LKETLEKVKPLYRTKAENNNNGVVNVELIRGFNQHREVKFIELLKNARKEILFMVQPEYFTSEEVDEITLGFFKKGGTIKSIYQAGEEFKYKTKDGWINGGVDDLIRIVENFERLGENARITDETVPNITIFDKETVFININDKTVPRHNEADVIFRTKDFANSMTTVFNSFWEKSKSVKEYKKSLKNIKTIRK
jgi:phosphatidylserine/phosphatidylglycerophosphate/cardiolipin synthase-like enzyme